MTERKSPYIIAQLAIAIGAILVLVGLVLTETGTETILLLVGAILFMLGVTAKMEQLKVKITKLEKASEEKKGSKKPD